jgi:hypothetical protein
MKPLNTLFGENAEILVIKAGGTCNYHYTLEGQFFSCRFYDVVNI